QQDKVIFHCDANGFFASVECLDHPELRNVPLAVAGDPKDRSGIILAKNELAKKYQIRTTETVWQAKRKCPALVLVSPHHERYEEVSKQLNAIYANYTDQVEPFGIDESWLDVTGSLKLFNAQPLALANRIREQVKNEIGITISVGVSFNKIFAKLGSDMKKPDATTLITRENFQALVWPLPAKDLLFVGASAAEALQRHYIFTIGDIARRSREELNQLLGKSGDMLWLYANGLGDEPVRRLHEKQELKSIGNGMTFRRDLVNEDEIRAGVLALTDEVATRMRAAQVKCCTVQVMLKNPAMKSISRQKGLPNPTHLQKELSEEAMSLIKANWHAPSPIRAITVTAMNLVPDTFAQQQLTFMDIGSDHSKHDKQEKLETALQQIRDRHGSGCIAMGYRDNDELGIRKLDRPPKKKA
ncbi:MAG: DNA polymerase IV, partial [Clostridia bacterium]